MKAFVAVLFAVVASTQAGVLSGGLYTTGLIPSSYGYSYNYATPYYTYATAPLVKTIAAPVVKTIAAPVVTSYTYVKPAVQATHIVREVATAPVTAQVVQKVEAPVVKTIEAPIVKTIAAPVVKTIAAPTIYATPLVKTVSVAPVVKTIASPIYSYASYAPYYGNFLLKK